MNNYLKNFLNIILLFMLDVAYLLIPFALVFIIKLTPLNDIFNNILNDQVKIILLALLLFYSISFLVFITLTGERFARYSAIKGAKTLEMESLISQITSLQTNLPITVEKLSVNKLRISWNYANEKFKYLFGTGYINSGYTITLKFDDSKHNVNTMESTYKITADAGGIIKPFFGFSASFFQGINLMKFDYDTEFGFVVKDGVIKFDNLYEYKFSADEIKGPLISIVTLNGWNFCPRVFLF